MIITLIISLLFRDIVDVSIIAGAISITLSFPMIYLLSGGKNPRKFVASTILGILAIAIGMFFLGIEPVVAIPVVIFSALGLLWR